MSNNNSADFTNGSILKKMIRFMGPILAALILQAMYGAVDILVVGQFGSNEGISGVNTGSSIVNLVIFTMAGLSMGITVVIGRYIGEKRQERIGKVIGGAVCFFAVISIVLMILMVVFARPLALLMKAPSEAVDVTVTYVRICGGGIAFIIAYNVISSIFRGLGNSKLPLIFVGIACFVNVVGDLLFVVVFKLDVKGAALATVMAQAVSVILSLIIIRGQELPFKVTKEDICFNSEIKNFLFVGTPIAFQEILTQVSFLALCAFINNISLAASSGYGIASKIVGFVMLVPAALMQSMSAFVAQNVGAGKDKRAKQSMLCGMAIGASIGVFIAIFAFMGGTILASAFTSNLEFKIQAADYLKGFAIEAVVTSVLFSYIGFFNGNGKTFWVMCQGIAQSFLVRLPMAYIMSTRPDASLIWIGIAAPTATVFGIIINSIYFFVFCKKNKK